MVDNKNKTVLSILGMVTNMFSAEEDEVVAFLGAWNDHLHIFLEDDSKNSRELERIVKDLKDHAKDKFNLEGEMINYDNKN